jgi:hypothetical protein
LFESGRSPRLYRFRRAPILELVQSNCRPAGRPEIFDEYCQDEGGDPDQICIVDDAAILLSTWRSSTYGERVADMMLRLYDCEGLSEAFRRNKKKATRTVKRSIPETSTTLLFGCYLCRRTFF